MLTSNEQNRIYQQAYVPEHIPEYVANISGGKPYLSENFLCYYHKNHLIIYKHERNYMKRSKTAYLLEARKADRKTED